MRTLRPGHLVHSVSWGIDNQAAPDHGEISIIQIAQAGEYPSVPLRSDRSESGANSSVCEGQHHVFL